MTTRKSPRRFAEGDIELLAGVLGSAVPLLSSPRGKAAASMQGQSSNSIKITIRPTKIVTGSKTMGLDVYRCIINKAMVIVFWFWACRTRLLESPENVCTAVGAWKLLHWLNRKEKTRTGKQSTITCLSERRR